MRRGTLLLAPVLLAACRSAPPQPVSILVRTEEATVPADVRPTLRGLAELDLARDDARLAPELERLAEPCGEAELARVLAAAARALAEGDEAQLEAANLLFERGPAIAVIGPRREDGARGLEVGLTAPGESAWVETWLGSLASFEAWIGLPPGRPFPRVGPLRRIAVADVVTRGGARAGSASINTFLPADVELRPALGRLSVFWRNLVRERWYLPECLPTAERVLAPEWLARFTAEAHLRWYATRFSTYQLGP